MDPPNQDERDQDVVIVLRMPRAQKGSYVAQSRADGMKLAEWIFSTLDAACDVKYHEK